LGPRLQKRVLQCPGLQDLVLEETAQQRELAFEDAIKSGSENPVSEFVDFSKLPKW
jgi:hypothetical protein